MIINMLFYLINKEMGKISFLFEVRYIIFRGWGKSPLPLDIFASNKPYIQFLYCFTVVYHNIHVMCKFKGKYAEKEAMGERGPCFPLNLTKPHLA